MKSLKRKAESRKRSIEREQQRKDDTRKKILIGACMLKITEENQENHDRLMRQLDSFLTSNRDRVLFNLSLINEE